MNAMPAVATVLSTASLDYAVFKKAILNATKVVEKKSTIPILDTVLIKAAAGGVLVTGTDLDVYTTTFVPGRADADFECLVDCHKMKSAMDKANDAETINFALSEDRLTASIGRLNLTLQQELEVDDFPHEAALRDGIKAAGCSFVMPSATLAKVLSKISFAISQEETRYYLNGVFMHLPEGRHKLTFVTTDGHRMARFEAEAPAGAGALEHESIIPRKTAFELLRLVKRKDCPADIQVTVSNLGIAFRIGEHELLESKLIDGTFPDYQRVIPAQNDKCAIAYVSDLVDAIKQASSISSERGKAIKLTMSPGRMQFSCTDPFFGTASTGIKATTGAEIEIAFNAGYLLEMLGHIKGAAQFKMAQPDAPAIITDTGEPGLTYVLMPTRA